MSTEAKHVKLVLPGNPDGGTASIEVDGEQISGQVRTVTVMAGVGQQTEVALELPLVEIEGAATVSMTAATRRLLLAYGWTPPEAAATAAEADPMPAFVLKGKDALAPGVIDYYRRECYRHDLADQAREVGAAFAEMAAWQERNWPLVKLPDHPHVPVAGSQESTPGATA